MKQFNHEPHAAASHTRYPVSNLGIDWIAGENIMDDTNGLYAKYRDENGEAYFCPLSAAADRTVDSEWASDHCVELSTTGRYAGNLDTAE